MIEIFVASMCLGGHACDYASKAYIAQNPYPKIWVEKEKKKLEKLVGEHMLVFIGTTGSALANRPFQVRITRTISVGRTNEGYGVTYGFSF